MTGYFLNCMKLEQVIKKERERQGISKYRLSEMIETNESYYGAIENGKKKFSLAMLIKVCAALNISITITPDGKTSISR